MNDARNKLRSMGGIMASSPQLMQAATQRFQNGGLAMTAAPMAPVRPAVQYNDIMRPQMEPPVVGLGRVAPVRPAGLPGSPVFRGGRGPVLGAADEEDVVAELMAQSGAFRGGRGPVEPVPSPLTPPTDPIEEAKTLDERIAALQGTAQRPGVASRTAELQAERAQMDPDIKAAATEQRFKDLVPKGAQEDPAEAEKIAQDAMDVLLKTQSPPGGGDDGGGGDGGGDDGQEAPAKSLEDYYKDARALISKVYGEEDDGVDNRMMDLAMIGLAIAAGQSPNALSNIAQGLLVGTQGMAQRREAERERERGLRTLALETAIGQQGAATEAEAEAARMDVEQQNKLELEREKARFNAMYGTGSREARNIIDFTQNAYDSAFKAASEQTAPDYDANVETPHQYAMRQAQQAAASMQRMFPGYGGTTDIGETPGAEGATVPTVTTQEEYDALPSGSQFMQNGQLRRKP